MEAADDLKTVGLVVALAALALAAVAVARTERLVVANPVRLAAGLGARKNGERKLVYAATRHIISFIILPLGVRVAALLQTQLQQLRLFGSCRFLLYFLLQLDIRESVRHGSWMV